DAESGILTEPAWELDSIVGSRRREPGLRLPERHARHEPPGGLEIMPLVVRVRVELKRDPDLRRRTELPKVELAEHADDLEGFTAEGDRFAHDVGVAVETQIGRASCRER